VHRAVVAVLHKHTADGTVDSHGVGIGSLAALEHDSIVVDVHVTATHKDVVALVDVDGVAARSFYALSRRKDEAIEIAHVVAVVEMVGPYGAVHQVYVLHGDMAGVADVHQPGPLCVLVGAGGIPLPPYPELLPVGVAIAVDGALAGDREVVDMVGIDESGKVLARLTLEACRQHGKVGNAVGAFQRRPLAEMEMSARLEEQRTAEKSACRDDDHTAALTLAAVDDSLDSFRLYERGITTHAIVGDDILFAEAAHIHFRGVAEPCVHRCTVGPGVCTCAAATEQQKEKKDMFHCFCFRYIYNKV